MEISRKSAEAALEYLATTDDLYAQAKNDVDRTEILKDRTFAAEFVYGDEGPIEQRKQNAKLAKTFQQAEEEWLKAKLVCDTIKNKRDRADLQIRLFQTLEASRRKGAIV